MTLRPKQADGPGAARDGDGDGDRKGGAVARDGETGALACDGEAGALARCGNAAWLAAALQASRADTLATFAAWQASPQGLRVPQQDTINPPLWELGHIGWFQEFWVARNPQRAAGVQADPAAARLPGVRAQADALYDSSHVPHATRWTLRLPDADATRADLTRQLRGTLDALAGAGDGDGDGAGDGHAALYFFRLALLHEDMHHEAALYTAHSLGVAIGDGRWQPSPLPAVCRQLAFDAGPCQLGSDGPGFAFDNEQGRHTVSLPAGAIDSRVLRWADYLPFAEAGGYTQPQWWTDAGRSWLALQPTAAPRYTRRAPAPGKPWQRWQHGRWLALDPALPACHLSAFEAQAWCRWAGRRLPTEAEWEHAALLAGDAFDWGQVWEWTASPFVPYPGFVPHPYRDYSAPWFGSRTLLRGASFMTQSRLRYPRFRNFFMAHRNDVAAGFRSCAV